MNLLVKTLFFIFTMFITVEEAKFSTVATISQERIAYLSRSSKAGGAAGQLGAQHIGGAVIGATRISIPVVQGAITGAVGGYAGGFTAGMLMTGDLGEANSTGWKGAAVGMSIGAASGSVSAYRYAVKNDINPWTGKNLTNSYELYRAVSPEELADIQQNGIRVNPDGTGYQHEKLFYKSYEDAVINTRTYDAVYGQKSIIIKVQGPNMPIYNNGYMDGFNVIRINSEHLNLLKFSK